MRGDGSVYQRPGSPFYWLAYTGPRVKGGWGIIRESSKSTDEDTAIRLLKKRVREVENHRGGIKKFSGPSAEKVTVGELLDRLERYYEVNRPKSLRTAKTAIAHVRAHFGNQRAASVTADQVREYVAKRLAAGAKPSYVNRATEKLQRAYKLAVEDGAIAFAPKIDALPEVNAREGTITLEDFRKRMEKVEDQDFRDFFEWLYWSAARPAGAAALTWTGFNKQDWSLQLHPSADKIGHGVTWALTGPFREIIERRLKRRRLDCNLIFYYGEGKALVEQTRNSVSYRYAETWRTAGAAAKVPAFELYALRRTAITNNSKAGIPEQISMTLSGHKTTSTFRRYRIVDGKDLQEATAKRSAYEATLAKNSAK